MHEYLFLEQQGVDHTQDIARTQTLKENLKAIVVSETMPFATQVLNFTSL